MRTSVLCIASPVEFKQLPGSHWNTVGAAGGCGGGNGGIGGRAGGAGGIGGRGGPACVCGAGEGAGFRFEPTGN